MVMLNLTVFEREKLRVAPDEMVARLRRLARDASRPRPSADGLDFRGAHASDTGGVSALPAVAAESAVGAQGVAKGGSLNLLSGRDETGTLLITEAEAGALEELNKTQKGFCEREGTRLSLAMHCGLILLPGSGGRRGRGSRAGIGRGDARAGGGQSHGGSEGATLEVLPKIWGAIERQGADETSLRDASGKDARQALTRARRALLRLLQARGELPISPIDSAPQDVDRTPLLELFVRSFLREALRVAKGGLLTRYIEVTDDQPVIRGRLHMVESERLARTRPGYWRCTHDDLSVDNPYNQALLAAIERVRPHARSRTTERLWLEVRAFFGGVSPLRVKPDFIDRLKHGRESARYDEALRWARLLLGLLSPTLAGGAASAPALLFNMQALFEHWVVRYERARAPEDVAVALKGCSRELATIGWGGASAGQPAGPGPARVFRQMPDISLWARNANRDRDSPEAIVDAKWKWLDPTRADWGVSDNDARQVLAYLLRYGCDRARLAYPVLSGARLPTAGPPTFWIDARGSAVSIEVVLVPIDV
ncbi:McrC family protein [Burkholderia sp. Bp9142]|uniref:McrC family protein n=1 Tax=Burkholderia sp. Bp9142 TaxID=2184573 RepID=UPI000F5AAA76|nr:hypothetical protein [Burkholderia sp. Bp9142]RQR26189.1 hypothetical protein DIE22_33655 [Burkholderia sp. Bp9142]